MMEWPTEERSEGGTVFPEREIRHTNLGPKLTQIWRDCGNSGAQKKKK